MTPFHSAGVASMQPDGNCSFHNSGGSTVVSVTSNACTPLVLRPDVQHALVVDHDRRVGVVAGPEPEHHVRPPRSHTAGSPVHPMPHHCANPARSCDSEHIDVPGYD